ncbi:MAG: ATP-binding protein [Candidatus Aenigmatarchaeota archaeon]
MDSEKIEEFFREFYEKEILAAAKLGKKSITVDFDAFDSHCRLIAEKLLNDPESMLPEIEKAASDAIVLPEIEGAASFRVRFKNLPDHQMIRIRSLRSEHIGKFVCVDGIVKRAGEVKPKIDVAEFECECGNKISVKQTEELLRYPSGCDMCGSKRGFKMIDKKLFDARWVVIEEPFEVTSGEKPGQVSVYLREDLTAPELQRKCDPGNRIKVTGIIKEMTLKTKGGARKVQSDIFVEANHVEPAEIEWDEVDISNKDVEAIKALAADPNVYNRIVGSIAPSIYGMAEVKEAILLQMMGGVQQKLLDGTRVRGDIHILLLGDPAVAKSQLLKMVSQLIPRGRYVSGKGASVKADEPVIIRNSHEIKMVPFGEFADKFYKKGEDGFSPPDRKIEALSLNLSTLKFEWKPIKSFYRHKIENDLIKFELDTGREITVTDDHSIFTLENGKITCKKASLLKEGDFAIVPAIMPVENPIDIGDDTARLLGYFIAEGHLHYGKDYYKIEFTLGKNETEIIQDIKTISRKVFGKDASYIIHGKNAVRITINGKEPFLKFKDLLGNAFGKKAKEKTIPNIIFNSSESCRKAFADAYMKGDKGVTKSKGLMSGFLYLLLGDGVIGSCNKREDSGIRRIEGRIITASGKRYDLKSPHPDKAFSNLYRKVPIEACPPLLRKYFFKKIINSKYSRANLGRLSNKMLLERLMFLGNNKIQTKEMKKKFGDKISPYMTSKKQLFKTERTGNGWFVSLSDEGRNILKEYEQFKRLCESDMGFARIKSILKEKPDVNYVYDFSVEGENFVSGFGGILCHNTGAGLTATVFRDEELMGGWVLEAGAMVLCHKGVIAIDEFDKMGKDDQIAMHEALEQQTISIAKASIIATLPAQVSVLAGANPKFSRFDVYRPLMEQTDIPDTLLSRFDLKFALRDVPDKDNDEKIASHILESRLNPEIRKPEISQDFLRKFIAYMRQNCHPKMTKEALERIKNFYVTMRGMYKGEDTVAITLRQNEALLRMTEASAKVRLSPVAEMQDAERAIRIMKVSLQQFGYDYETGKIDVDRTEGTSSSQRSKIRILLDVIEALEKRIGKQIPKEDIIAEAEDHGLKGVDDMIQKMKSEGMLFEPKHNVIQKL